MKGKGTSRANENKRIRQEALREQLEAQGHVQHVVDITEKLMDLDMEIDSAEVYRLRAAADIKLKLINKYAPDLKSVEYEDTTERSLDDMTEADILERLAELRGNRAAGKTAKDKAGSEVTH